MHLRNGSQGNIIDSTMRFSKLSEVGLRRIFCPILMRSRTNMPILFLLSVGSIFNPKIHSTFKAPLDVIITPAGNQYFDMIFLGNYLIEYVE